MTADSLEASHTANRRGIVAISASMACFVANDTLVKYGSQSMPASQLGTVLQALRDFVTRTLPRSIPSVLMTWSTAFCVTVMAGIWAPFEHLEALRGWQYGLLAAASVFLSGGYYLVTVAMRSGDISLIAPFRYSALVYALVLGYAIWGTVPNAVATSGIALLVGSGLFMLHLQRRG